MRRDFDSEFTEEFAEGAARALWVSAWASEMEEKGETFPGEDVMDVAPPTPLSAWVAAGELIGRLEQANGVVVEVLAARAAEADGNGYDVTAIDASEFGHYLAMEALGHGVSWFDNHESFKIKMPSMEYNFYEG